MTWMTKNNRRELLRKHYLVTGYARERKVFQLFKEPEKIAQDKNYVKQLNYTLEEFATWYENIENWALAGGISLHLQLGKIVRKHGDFDIVVHESALPKIVEASEEQGYFLFKREAMFKFHPNSKHKEDIYYPLTAQEALEDRRPNRNLRLLNINQSGKIQGRVTPIDIYLYHQESGVWISNEDRLKDPDSYLENKHCRIKDRTIPVINLEHTKKRKESLVERGTKNQVHQFDLDLLKQYEKTLISHYVL